MILAMMLACDSEPATPPVPEVDPKDQVAATGLDDGVRGLAWGSAPVDGMKLIREEHDVATYSLGGEKLSVGDIPLQSVDYQYLSGQLYTVMLWLDLSDCVRLEGPLVEKYGPPFADEPELGFKSWAGHKSSVMLSTTPINCVLSYDHSELSKKQRAASEERKAAAHQEAVEDL